MLIYSQATDRGRLRKNNEDSMLIDDPKDTVLREKKGVLFAVADGLGGMEHGELASAGAVLHLGHLFQELTEFNDPRWLREAMRSVNQKIYNINQRMGMDERMGTTLTASIFLEEEVVIGHVGDSRMYQIRDGNILRLTTDHSIDRYTLTRAIGTESEVDVDLVKAPLKAGDIYIQCSDGLYSMVSDEEILLVATGHVPEESCKRLVALANEKGGSDNITLQVIRVTQ